MVDSLPVAMDLSSRREVAFLLSLPTLIRRRWKEKGQPVRNSSLNRRVGK